MGSPTLDPALTLRASDLPGVLSGWTGAVIAETRVGLQHAVYSDDVGRLWFTDRPDAHPEEMTEDWPACLFLDASRSEVADRIARVVAARVGLAVGATAPEWADARFYASEPRCWGLRSRREAPILFSHHPTFGARLVPALAGITDPAAALVAVARHVGLTPAPETR